VWRCGVVASGTKLETGLRAVTGVMISAISRASRLPTLWLSGCAAPELVCAHHTYLSYEDTGIPVWLRIRDTRAHHTGKSEARKLGIGDWHSELGFRGDVQLIAISNTCCSDRSSPGMGNSVVFVCTYGQLLQPYHPAPGSQLPVTPAPYTQITQSCTGIMFSPFQPPASGKAVTARICCAAC
jgi:hypothetical protein